jgi:single-strand DNA-binding protein
MPRTVNQVILLGFLGKDPEVRYTPSGTIIAEMSLATTERVKQNGEWVDRTEWHRLKAFNRTAEICRDYLRKGAQLYVEGKLQTSSWKDKESGAARYKTEIMIDELIMLGDSSREKPATLSDELHAAAKTPPPSPSIWKEGAFRDAPVQEQFVDPSGADISDEDIPF